MKKILSMLLTLGLLMLPLLACASTDEAVAHDTAVNATASANATNLSLMKKEPILSVVHPDFQLTDGFIEPVQRQTTVPEGYIAISTPAEFCKIGLNPAGNYILMGDIDLEDTGFSSISDFNGILEGNGYTVRNAQMPVFTKVSQGTVQNLGVYSHLSDALYNANNSTVSPMGYVTFGGIAYSVTDGATIFNCWFDGSIQSFTPMAAGIAQYASAGSTIQSCRNSANISIATEWAQDVVCGGIAGEIGKDVSIINCLNEGTLKIEGNTSGEQSLGGIVGQLSITTDTYGCLTQVYNCRNTGSLSGRDYVAGIVGYVDLTETYAAFSLRQCLNEGSAQPASNLSGIVNIHYIEDGSITIMNCANVSTTAFTTGIVGGEFLQRRYHRLSSDLMNVYVECCFSVAPVEQGISSLGKSLNNCYYLGTDTPATADGALFATVKGLSQQQMQQKSSFSGFDFDTVWAMGSSYPEFRQTTY